MLRATPSEGQFSALNIQASFLAGEINKLPISPFFLIFITVCFVLFGGRWALGHRAKITETSSSCTEYRSN